MTSAIAEQTDVDADADAVHGIVNPQPARCIHCTLPIPAGVAQIVATGFCCSGCEAAYRLITGAGFGAYYAMGAERRLVPALDDVQRVRYESFDQKEFLSKFTRRHADNRRSIRLALAGVHCAACVWLLEKLPRIVPGVLAARVAWAGSTIDIEWNPQVVPLSRIAAVLGDLGYAPYAGGENSASAARQRNNRDQLIRLAVAGAAAGNNMLIAAALYLGLFSGMDGSIEQLLRIASAVVGVFSLAWPGRIFVSGAISALRTRTPHMDLPLALGLTVGTVGGVLNTVRGIGDVYFDSISVLVFVLLLGRWIQSRQQLAAAESIDLLSRLTPRWVRRRDGQRFVEVAAALLRIGDHVDVRAGEILPVDGVVVAGSGLVDESVLTGESIAVAKRTGDRVFAGSLSQHAALEIRADAVGVDTRVGRIATVVENAAKQRPQIVQWADRIGGRFVVIVMAFALLVWVYWMAMDPARALDRAVALLIVACPCALAMATPLAVAVGIAQAAKRQILIKGGDVLQRLSGRGHIWLDKTGTLTRGQMQLTDWFGDRAILPVVAAIQAQSAHPIAIAMARDIPRFIGGNIGGAPALPKVEQGIGGIRAVHSGRQFFLGNRRFIVDSGIAIGSRFERQLAELLAKGVSPVYIAVDGEVVAVAGVGDPLRGDANRSLSALRQLGWTVGILSGDHRTIVERVARQLAIPVEWSHAELLPEEKVAFVRQGHATTVMVGDGVNDSGALAAASVGVAVRRGAEASLAAAPVYLAREGLNDLVRLMRLSRATMRTIRWNFAASLAYNALAIGLAAVGLITPLLAAVLMPASSLTVVAISLIAPRGWQKEMKE